MPKGKEVSDKQMNLADTLEYRGKREGYGDFSDVSEGIGKLDHLLLGDLTKQKFLQQALKIHSRFLELCEYGIGASTIAPDIIEGLVKNQAITSAVDDFIKDFETLTGEGKTMSNYDLY